jgi:hypothetical protein
MILAAAAMIAPAAPALAQSAALPPPAKPDRPAIRPIVDLRLREEFVDQKDLPKNAQALTVRARIGVEADLTETFHALVEAEGIGHLTDSFNDTLNGKTQYPLVSDPESLEINRAQLSWTGLPDSEVILGRQRLVFGNARFIGDAGWRDNQQTFDAVTVVNGSLRNVKLTYAYFNEIDRVLGENSPQGRWRSDSHALQAVIKTPLGQFSGYAFLLDILSQPAQSSKTFGARLAGAQPIGSGLKATCVAEYARQSDYGSNPSHFNLDYAVLEAGVEHGATTLSAGLERLGGDGRNGFLTPLSSAYGFQGWSDAIVAAPRDGVLDLHVKAAAHWTGAPVGDGLHFLAAAYRFTNPRDGTLYGNELDAGVATALTPNVTLDVRAAVFDGNNPAFASRTKLWLTAEFHY